MTSHLLAIASIMREFGETGVQKHVNTLQRYLKTKGRSSVLVTPFSAPAYVTYPIFGVRKAIDPLSKVASIWWYRYWHYQCLKSSLQSIYKQNPTSIYSVCPLSAYAALETRPSSATRVVMKVGFNISEADELVGKRILKQESKYYHSIRNFESNVLPRLDGLVYVSNFIRRELEYRIPKLCDVQSLVLPNFTDPNTGIIQASPADLITIGTLEPRKNHAYLLEIVAECRRRGKCYKLTIIGTGPERNKLESLARTLHIADQVKFLGYCKHASKYIPGHRVYCHTARMESFGIVLIEAMAAGLPVLAAPVGGIPEILRDHSEGFYWPLDNVTLAASILINTLENKSLYQSLSRAALNRFQSRFSTESVAETLYHFLMKNELVMS